MLLRKSTTGIITLQEILINGLNESINITDPIIIEIIPPIVSIPKLTIFISKMNKIMPKIIKAIPA